ncbi:MAG: acyl carrier protein [Nitrospirae bacterium]|nr:acyl carrier protein [Magnetococcales bacterium]HAT50207.1 acyl carrier protein [Alphaproteobacteria bacterium]
MDGRSQEILLQLNRIFRDVFDDDGLQVTCETTAKDIEEWDSVEHIALVIAIEKAFKVRLNAAEVGKLQNVGGIVELLMERSKP